MNKRQRKKKVKALMREIAGVTVAYIEDLSCGEMFVKMVNREKQKQ